MYICTLACEKYGLNLDKPAGVFQPVAA